jgi:hypothetical protein
LLIAFVILSACNKPTSGVESKPTSPIDKISGDWTGKMFSTEGGDPVGQLDMTFNAACDLDKICGNYSIPKIPCNGNLIYKGLNQETIRFEQDLVKGDIAICGTGSINEVTLQIDGTLSQTWTDGTNKTVAILSRK